MRPTFSSISVLFLGLLSTSLATAGLTSSCGTVAANIVQNCGFETGDFTNWTLSGNISNPGDNFYGVDAFDANSGNFGAYLSEDSETDGGAALVMSQTLALQPSTMYSISFYLAQFNPPSGTYTHSFVVSFDGTTLTPAIPSSLDAYTQFNYTFTTAASGNNDILSFAIVNDDDFYSLDDIVVTGESPEPSSILLLGSGLLALGAAGIRRRGKTA